ncbi:unnamed protein product, partial [Prorocentrum cordatum]
QTSGCSNFFGADNVQKQPAPILWGSVGSLGCPLPQLAQGFFAGPLSQGSRRPRASCGPPPAAMSRGAPRHGAVHGGRHAAMSAFASMDLNGDGVVTQEEFCAAQRRMAAQHPGGRPAGGPEWLAAPPAVQAMRGVSRIEVQEKVNAIEAGAALLGQEVEMPNRYAVIDGATHQQVFFAVEQTGFVQRQLKQCFGDCTPWNLDIFYTGRGAPQKA